MKIETEITINASISATYDAFRDLHVWLEILPDVSGIDILYDDTRHQEFLMRVTPAGEETIRGIRFCAINDRINLFQPAPPPGFKKMTGTWKFKQIKEQTKVIVHRDFELQSNSEVECESKARQLHQYLRTNLAIFKQHLEKENENIPGNYHSS